VALLSVLPQRRTCGGRDAGHGELRAFGRLNEQHFQQVGGVWA